MAGTLLDTVCGLLQRTYAMEPGLDRLDRYVIGDRGYRELYPGPQLHRVDAAAGRGARTLVRNTREGIRACVYFPDEQIRTLEEHPPQHGIGDRNVDAFATFVEELDHLLLIAERSRQRRRVSLFELELHANVSKHLVLARYLAREAAQLSEARRKWLRHHLFGKAEYCDIDRLVRERYRDAARWAVRLLDALPRMRPQRRLGTLREFHASGRGGKIEMIRRLQSA